MDLIRIGSGYFGDVISVAVIAFLVLLAAFIALNVIIACRYHSTKHAFAEDARRVQGRVAAAARLPADQIPVTPGNAR